MVLRLNQLLASKQFALSEVGDVLSRDPGLSAKVLELVNSSVYGLKTRVETVNRAVVMIGAEQVRQLVIATSVVKMFKSIPHNLIQVEDFWKHCVACGAIAKKLAELQGEEQPDRFFVAGLLHDVGRLILYLKAPEKMNEVFEKVKDGEMLFHEAERKVFGFNHAEVGFQLCRIWSLPDFFRETAGYHHNPEDAFRHHEAASLIHIADFIANALQLGSSGQKYVPLLDDFAWNRSGFTSSIAEGVVNESMEKYEEAIHVLL